VNQYVNLGRAANLNFGAGSFSISLWFKPAVGNVVASLLNKGTYTTVVRSGWFVFQEKRFGNANAIGFSVNSFDSTGAFFEVATTSGQYTVGQWNQVTCVWDAATKTPHIYINGVEAAVAVTQTGGGGTPTIGNTNVPDLDLLLGVYNPSAANPIQGQIADLRLYSDALTANQARWLAAPTTA